MGRRQHAISIVRFCPHPVRFGSVALLPARLSCVSMYRTLETAMNRTALILLPHCDPTQERAAFELWWQGATAVAFGAADHAALPVPAEREFRSQLMLQLWLFWRGIDRIVVIGRGAEKLADRLSARRAVALPLRIA